MLDKHRAKKFQTQEIGEALMLRYSSSFRGMGGQNRIHPPEDEPLPPVPKPKRSEGPSVSPEALRIYKPILNSSRHGTAAEIKMKRRSAAAKAESIREKTEAFLKVARNRLDKKVEEAVSQSHAPRATKVNAVRVMIAAWELADKGVQVIVPTRKGAVHVGGDFSPVLYIGFSAGRKACLISTRSNGRLVRDAITRIAPSWLNIHRVIGVHVGPDWVSDIVDWRTASELIESCKENL